MWYVIGTVAALLTSFGFLPQIIRMLRTRSVHDISPIMLLQFCLGLSLWLTYGIHLKDVIIIIANSTSLFMGLLVTGLYFYFKKREHLPGERAG